MNRKLGLLFAILVLASAIIFFSCAPEKLGGSLKENLPPEISFTNIPYNDSVFTSNALVYWYGEDSDGQVTKYYYIIKEAVDIGAEPAVYINTVLDTLSLDQWIETTNTSVSIQMYAADNEADTLHQYLFVKCQDDAGSFSEIIYYSLFRLNRLPQTYLQLLPGNYTVRNPDSTYTTFTDPVWSLPDTNALWRGLTITWSGDDTLDFPDGAPDFQYEWKLYGPYDISHFDTTSHLIDITLDGVSDDSIYAMSCADNLSDIYYPLPGEGSAGCENPWVWSKTTTLTNLPAGCYLFSATARDDALVPDTSAAWGTFAVVMPVWIQHPEQARDIALIRATQYRNYNPTRFPGRPYFYNADGTAYYPDSLLNFYIEMIIGAGFDSLDATDIFGSTGTLADSDYPSIFELAKHRMIIFDDMDWHGRELGPNGTGPFINPLNAYLAAGGKAWVIGRQSFDPMGGGDPGLADFDGTSLAFNFFDLSSGIYAQPSDTGDTEAEFIGAAAIYGGYSDLVISPERTLQMGQYGLNKVEALVRYSVHSTTLFTYRAANPDTMQAFQLMPCAVRYYPENHVYKTSYFSFPLYMMDNSEGQIQAVFTDMLHWFLEE